MTEETIKALAEDTARNQINEWTFNGWNNLGSPLQAAIISSMCEMYKAALSGTEVKEVYVECPMEEGHYFSQKLGGSRKWLKQTALTVVPNHQ